MRLIENLIKDNDGQILQDNTNIPLESILILINNSYISNGNVLVESKIFVSEMDFQTRHLWNILKEKTQLINANVITTWLEEKKLNLNSDNLIKLGSDQIIEQYTISDESDTDTGIDSNSNASEVSTEIEDNLSESVLESKNKGNSSEQSLSKIDTNKVTSIPSQEYSGNELIINVLSELSEKYLIQGDSFRHRSYKLALQGVSKYPHKIRSSYQAQRDIPQVGASIAKKIELLLNTGTLPGLLESYNMELDKLYFINCYGIGPSTIGSWNSLGIHTLNEAKNKFIDFFSSEWPVLFGWRYYEDWLTKIPRDECIDHLNIVKKELKKIDKDVVCEIQGSYARGKSNCGDIDFLFYKIGSDNMFELYSILTKLAINLFKSGYIKCFLHFTEEIYQDFEKSIDEILNQCNLSKINKKKMTSNKSKIFMGAKLPGQIPNDKANLYQSIKPSRYLKPEDKYMSYSVDSNDIQYPCRRIDFFSCKWSQIGAAKIHYIGPADFNRKLRIYASQKGMKLTQHGLFKNNQLIVSNDEEAIFKELGLYNIPVEEREDFTFP